MKCNSLSWVNCFIANIWRGGEQKEYLELLLNQQDPNQIARNMYYYGYLTRARAEGIDALRAKSSTVGFAHSRKPKEKSAEIAVIQAKQAEHKKQLEQQKAEHAKLLARISLQADQQRREIGKLKRDEERLSRLVEKLAEDARPQKESHDLPFLHSLCASHCLRSLSNESIA